MKPVAPAMLTVYDGTEARGFILRRARGFEAFTADERSIGLFETAPDAANAIADAATNERGAI